MAASCWLLGHLLIAHPLNQLVLDLIKQHSSREVEGITEHVLKSRVHISEAWAVPASQPGSDGCQMGESHMCAIR